MSADVVESTMTPWKDRDFLFLPSQDVIPRKGSDWRQPPRRRKGNVQASRPQGLYHHYETMDLSMSPKEKKGSPARAMWRINR